MVHRSSDPLRLDRASDLVDYYSTQQPAPSSTGPAPATTGAADTGEQAGAAGHKQIS